MWACVVDGTEAHVRGAAGVYSLCCLSWPATLAVIAAPWLPRSEESEMDYWLGVLQAQIPTVMEKAIASENHTKGTHIVVACRVEVRLHSAHAVKEGTCSPPCVLTSLLYVCQSPRVAGHSPLQERQVQCITTRAPGLCTCLV